MCFVYISEQTVTISLHSINLMGLMAQRECIYYAVGTESFNIIEVNLML